MILGRIATTIVVIALVIFSNWAVISKKPFEWDIAFPGLLALVIFMFEQIGIIYFVIEHLINGGYI